MQRPYRHHAAYLNLKEDPRVKRTGLGLGLGSSKRRKKAWYSTQIFQKILQQSRLAITNSSVSWYALCCRDTESDKRQCQNVAITANNIRQVYFHLWKSYSDVIVDRVLQRIVMWRLTFRSGLSLMRNLFRLKLSLRTLDQLKALILVCPCRRESRDWSRLEQHKE